MLRRREADRLQCDVSWKQLLVMCLHITALAVLHPTTKRGTGSAHSSRSGLMAQACRGICGAIEGTHNFYHRDGKDPPRASHRGHYLAVFGGGCRESDTPNVSFLPLRKPTKRSSTRLAWAPVMSRRTSLMGLPAVSMPSTETSTSPTSTRPLIPTGPLGRKLTT